MPETKDIPSDGDHVRLDTDPRDVGLPVTMAQEGSRLVVEGTVISDNGLIVALRPIGEETVFRLRRGDIRPVQ